MRQINDCLAGTKYGKEDLELFLAECYLDYLFFAEHVLGFEISEYHKEWYELIDKFPRVCLQAFRGSGKTNWIGGYFLWKGIFSGPKNILIVSDSFEQSKLVLKLVRNMISDNELLQQYIPQGKEGTWKATELTLKNGTIFYSRAYTDGVRGLRIDLLLCDEAGKYEDKSLFWTAISPVVQLNRGKIIVIGTPTSHIDLLQELHDNDEYYAKKYPAEINDKPLWDKKYTMEPHDTDTKRSLVAVRKEIGELPYTQEYLLIPISAANSLFPLDLTMKLLENKKFLPYGRVNDRYYVGVDLAISAKGDYTVYTVIKSNEDGKEIVYAERFRGSLEEQIRRLKRISHDFRPIKIIADKTGLGEQIFLEMSKDIPNMEPMHFTAEDKYKLIMDLRHEIENYQITIPNSKDDTATYNYTQELLKELNEYTVKVKTETGKLRFGGGAYDDCVISLALAVKASQRLGMDFSVVGF